MKTKNETVKRGHTPGPWDIVDRGGGEILISYAGKRRAANMPKQIADKPRWNDNDQKRALAEGWALFNLETTPEIQRDDEAEKFASDEEAEKFVTQQAQHSAFHDRALAVLNWYKLPRCIYCWEKPRADEDYKACKACRAAIAKAEGR
jgi:hypothetical protein